MFNGFLDLPVWGYIGVLLVLTHITIVSVTVFLHRHQAHRALELHPLVSHFFRLWLWLTTGMVTKQWVAVHRKHHAKCETPEDPHSPQVLGLQNVLWKGAELYRAEASNGETLEKYGHGTPDDMLEHRLYSRFPYLGIVIMLAVDFILFGFAGITIFALQMIWIPFWAAGVINGIGHFWGYRNFETNDAATNISPIGILIGGEELHNNHHAHASSAKLSNKWWEFDIGWFYIRVFSLLGLAQVKRTAPKVNHEPGKTTIDIETVHAVIRNRFHIMKLYGRNVIRPVIKEESEKANQYFKSLMKRSRRLMIREDVKIDLSGKAVLREVFDHSQALHTVYEFKQNLKELWLRSSNNQLKRVAKLQEWCVQAEATGIKVLQDFARSIHGYSLTAGAA